MYKILTVTPRVFPGSSREAELVFQMTDKKGRYIGEEIPLIKSELKKESVQIRLTDEGAELVLKRLPPLR